MDVVRCSLLFFLVVVVRCSVLACLLSLVVAVVNPRAENTSKIFLGDCFCWLPFIKMREKGDRGLILKEGIEWTHVSIFSNYDLFCFLVGLKRRQEERKTYIFNI